MSGVLSALSLIWQIVQAIPQIISLVREVWRMIEKSRQDAEIERRKRAVDETAKTGDQRSEEEAISGRPSGPTNDPTGVKIRRPRDRSKDDA